MILKQFKFNLLLELEFTGCCIVTNLIRESG